MHYSLFRNMKICTIGIISVLCLLMNSCDEHNKSVRDANQETPLQDIPYNTAIEIRIPTYEGSNQAVHPDVIPLHSSAWLEAKYAMAFTPYPHSDDSVENPSLVISTDGVHFYEPVRGLNPLVPAPPTDHNNDPDIVYDAETGQYLLHYLESCRPDSQSIIRLTSNDLVHWSKKSSIVYKLSENFCFTLSPSYIMDASNKWFLYYVNNWGRPTRIEYLVSADGLNWQKKAIQVPIHINKPDFIPWHLDIIAGKDWYYMLACGMPANPNLYIARSQDLQNWEWSSQPILTPGAETLNSSRIYRSSGIVQDNDLFVYFSYVKPVNVWGIGLVRLNLNNLF